MRRSLRVVVLVGFALGAVATADESTPAPVRSLLEEANAHREAGRLDDQLDAARHAHELAPEDVDALLRLARAHYDLGNAAEGEARDRHYAQSATWARRAADVAPERAASQLWVAIAVGKMALAHGGREKLELSREIHDAARRAVFLDPDEADALHVLARWHYEVKTLSWWERAGAEALGGLPDASLDEATRLLERAVALEPRAIRHRLLLARVHLRAGREGAARVQLDAVLALPGDQPDDPSRKARARELLDAL
jgi:tetratricopeptide (TPR) repeat protein